MFSMSIFFISGSFLPIHCRCRKFTKQTRWGLQLLFLAHLNLFEPTSWPSWVGLPTNLGQNFGVNSNIFISSSYSSRTQNMIPYIIEHWLKRGMVRKILLTTGNNFKNPKLILWRWLERGMVRKILLTTGNNFKNLKLFFLWWLKMRKVRRSCWQQEIISIIPNWSYDDDWRGGWCAKSCWQQEIISKIPNFSYDDDWRGGLSDGKSIRILHIVFFGPICLFPVFKSKKTVSPGARVSPGKVKWQFSQSEYSI